MQNLVLFIVHMPTSLAASVRWELPGQSGSFSSTKLTYTKICSSSFLKNSYIRRFPNSTKDGFSHAYYQRPDHLNLKQDDGFMYDQTRAQVTRSLQKSSHSNAFEIKIHHAGTNGISYAVVILLCFLSSDSINILTDPVYSRTFEPVPGLLWTKVL